MSDAFFQKFLNDPASREARDWLKSGTGNTLGELDSAEESLAIVDNAYAAGAIKVIAVEIDNYGEFQNTGKLIIELPKAAEKRASVFAWAAPIAESQGYDGEEDEGQPYLFLMLD